MNKLHMIFIINLSHTKFAMFPKILNHHNNALFHIATIYCVEWWNFFLINFSNTTNFNNSHNATQKKKKNHFYPNFMSH
jgi:hypothetical protein